MRRTHKIRYSYVLAGHALPPSAYLACYMVFTSYRPLLLQDVRRKHGTTVQLAEVPANLHSCANIHHAGRKLRWYQMQVQRMYTGTVQLVPRYVLYNVRYLTYTACCTGGELARTWYLFYHLAPCSHLVLCPRCGPIFVFATLLLSYLVVHKYFSALRRSRRGPTWYADPFGDM